MATGKGHMLAVREVSGGRGPSNGPGRGRRDVELVGALCAWFGEHARALPWRSAPGAPRDPYASLVSEVMLQQTQVSRVVEKFGAFMARFGSVEALAQAPEGEVLAAWSGMGYYRRARNLQAAARAIVERHGGVVPREVAMLEALPGVGRYTAGAVASIVYGEAAATVDGNIARVLLRVDGRELDAVAGVAWAWGRAEELVAVAASAGGDGLRSRGTRRGGEHRVAGPGVLNEGLMELGALVCVPRSPRCGVCPLRSVCVSAREGKQERIPAPKVRAVRSVLHCASVVAEDGRGRVLVEQRGSDGMWAGLWQAPTVECARRAALRRDLESMLGLPRASLVKAGSFAHATTHRDVRFVVWQAGRLGAAEARAVVSARPGACWKSRSAVKRLGLSNAQRRILLGAG